jgi:hypothetical protein
MSMMRAVWSPDAVARSKSSEEKAMSMRAFECGCNERCVEVKFGHLESINRTPPDWSPIAISEFVLQAVEQNGNAGCANGYASSGRL